MGRTPICTVTKAMCMWLPVHNVVYKVQLHSLLNIRHPLPRTLMRVAYSHRTLSVLRYIAPTFVP